MIKTTVYLEEDLVVELRRLAEARKRSQAELIRDALRTYVKREGRRSKRPTPVGLGAFASSRSDVGRKAEQILRSAARKRVRPK